MKLCHLWEIAFSPWLEVGCWALEVSGIRSAFPSDSWAYCYYMIRNLTNIYMYNKFELVLTRRAKACSSCFSQIVLLQVVPYITRLCYGVFTRSSKRPANFQQMYSKYTWIAGRLLESAGSLLDVCWKFAGRLLDRVNTPLVYLQPLRRNSLLKCMFAAAKNGKKINKTPYFRCLYD